MNHEPPALRHRGVRSFVKRGGRLGSGQRRALDELAPQYVLPYSNAAIEPEAIFGRRAPLVFEIGFGMGDATAAMAAAGPGRDWLGCEVHEAGVGSLLARIEALGLRNLRIVRHDAVEVLQHMLAPASLAAIHLYFPDPWPKKRHLKRRLVQPAWATLAASRLAPGGLLHCATDWQPYAEQMLQVLNGEPLLRNTAPDATGYAPRPAWRPLTKFEARGQRLGHGSWDLIFERRAAGP